MPQLRVLDLSGDDAGLAGALLEDASGCAQLQELRLRVTFEWFDLMYGSSWTQGLAALAAGPCRHSLRSIKIEGVRIVLCSPTQAAPLLLPGAMPQLRELQLDMVVHAASLMPRRSARLQQARAGAAATQWSLQQELPGRPEHLQLLVGELRQAGVQGLGGIRLTGDSGRISGFAGCVGRSQFSGSLQVVSQPRVALVDWIKKE
jgi:hypothetical protein